MRTLNSLQSLRKLRIAGILMLLVLFGNSCGGVTTVTNGQGQTPPAAAIHVTDYFSSSLLTAVGNLAAVAPPDILANVLAPVPHTDAALRAFGTLLYVINRLGRDSIQVIDPAAGFATLVEFSTGNGTNPQDIFVASDDKAYITLYDPQNDPGAEELLIVDPTDGTPLDKIDLTPLTDDDGDRNVRATLMCRIGNELWILIQDLDSAFSADTNGKIAVLDLNTDTLIDLDPKATGIQTIQLEGRNPSGMACDTANNQVIIIMTGLFQPDFTTDTSDPHGGIEVVTISNYTTQGIVIDDFDLGAYPQGVALDTVESVFTVVGGLTVAWFDLNTDTVLDADIYSTPGFFLPQIALDGAGHLLIAERGDMSGQNAGLVILDIDNGFAMQGPLDVGGPPNAIAVGAW